MGKTIIIPIIFLICLQGVLAFPTADNLISVMNPFTGTGDIIRSDNQTGENWTADYFFGLFNWIIKPDISTDYLEFNSSDLSFNETKLNKTIPILMSNTTIARTGDCPIGYVVQNTTTGGVECITIESTTYYANASHVDGGSYTDESYINATHYYDEISLNFTEGGGIEPLNVTINFTGVESFAEIVMREHYIGSASHHIQIQVWDYDSSSWDDYFDFVGQSGYTVLGIPVHDIASHIQNGVVQIRFHHIQNGVASHRLNIDYIWLIDGNEVGGSTNLEGYAKYSFNYNNFIGNGNMTLNTLYGWWNGSIDYFTKTDIEAKDFVNHTELDNGTILRTVNSSYLNESTEDLITSKDLLNSTEIDNVTIIRDVNHTWINESIGNDTIIRQTNITWVEGIITSKDVLNKTEIDNNTILRNHNMSAIHTDLDLVNRTELESKEYVNRTELDNSTILRYNNLTAINTDLDLLNKTEIDNETIIRTINSSVYLDDTTIGNCSVTGSCTNVVYDNETILRTDNTTFINTALDLLNQSQIDNGTIIRVDNTTWVTDNAPAGGGTANGTNGEVQFANAEGGFGGDGNLTWDDANNRLGIGTSSPSYPLHVKDDVVVKPASTYQAEVEYTPAFGSTEFTATANHYGLLIYKDPSGTAYTDTFGGVGFNNYGASFRLLPSISVTGGSDAIAINNYAFYAQVFNTNIFADESYFGTLSHTDRGAQIISQTYSTYDTTDNVVTTTQGLLVTAAAQVTNTASGTMTNTATGLSLTAQEYPTNEGDVVNVKGMVLTASSLRGSSPATVSGIWLNDVTGGTSNYGLVIDSDTVGTTYGKDQDAWIYWDGVNMVYNVSSGYHYFEGGNISVAGITYHTDVKEGDQLSTFKDGSTLLKEDGKIDHQEFGECYVPMPVVDYDKPVLVNQSYYECIDDEDNLFIVNEEDKDNFNVDLCEEKYMELITYPNTKIYDGVSGDCQDARQSQALAQVNEMNVSQRLTALEQENSELKARIEAIENMLNITDTTKADEKLYYCSYKEARECLGGLSAINKDGLQTRCYNYLKLGWSNCDTGWVEI